MKDRLRIPAAEDPQGILRPRQAAGEADAGCIGKPANEAGAEKTRGADPSGVLKRSFSPTGLFGKLPAHGDFIRRALPESFVSTWDEWAQAGMVDAKASLGEAFAETWEAAPAWRFRLPAGACGPDAALGVILPSQDLVGRRFPLVLATMAEAAPDEAFYAALERIGRAAQLDGETADALVAALPAALPGESPPAYGWWRIEAGEALCWDLPGLPPATQFRVLLEGGA